VFTLYVTIEDAVRKHRDSAVVNMVDDNSSSHVSRLAQSAYNSPYSHTGAPSPHPNTNPYAPLRTKALATLESMGHDPETMVERGVL
jgi:hypothetical protein